MKGDAKEMNRRMCRYIDSRIYQRTIAGAIHVPNSHPPPHRSRWSVLYITEHHEDDDHDDDDVRS